MAALLPAAKISELPFRNPIALCSRPSFYLLRSRFIFFASSSSVRSSDTWRNHRSHNYPWDDDSSDGLELRESFGRRRSGALRSSGPSAPWLQQWSEASNHRTKEQDLDRKNAERESPGSSSSGSSSIERIVHRLRNLGLGAVDVGVQPVVTEQRPLDGDERLGELLERSWNPPGSPGAEGPENLLPWERGNDYGDHMYEDLKALKKRKARAPTLAELTIEDAELRRLRRLGMNLRERTTVPKAGVSQAVLEKIHDAWRKSEIVRLRFHESLAHDMKTAHELVELRTGGLVIWRAGSAMVVYRGSNYKRPSIFPSTNEQATSAALEIGEDSNFVPGSTPADVSNDCRKIPDKVPPSLVSHKPPENMTAEEAEFNNMLEDLGPRFIDWWGTGILPVDADLLPQHIPGYKTPFRLLPTGMRSCLTNSELTNMRKLAKSTPCHFALGRNRNHQGLASAILKLWEKSLVVKIAVKQGIQNTNNKLMAEELKKLTGGTLLLRNKFYIVMYRGKDFLPTAVATALAERDELVKDIQDVEDRVRICMPTNHVDQNEEGFALAGTLAEFQEARARWGVTLTVEEHAEIRQDASRMKASRLLKRTEHKLSLAQDKKYRAEKLLAKVEASMVPVRPSDDQEMITDEERSVFRRIGLRMKAYLPLGIRGVFDGVIENMHLHWKHREIVKLISKQKTLSFVEDTARLLEYESGGILVSIDRVPKGYALIYYRGKNYRRPISLRPRNLLTKAKALKRSVAMQRHEALSQHIAELEKTINHMKLEMGEGEELSVGLESADGIELHNSDDDDEEEEH